MLSVSSMSVLSKFATVKVSSDNLHSSGLPGTAVPPTALLVDTIGLKVNELDGAPEGASVEIPRQPCKKTTSLNSMLCIL